MMIIDDTDVLLVTATEIETQELISHVKILANLDYCEVSGNVNTYFDFGLIGKTRCVLVQSGMSSRTPSSSSLTVSDAIKELNPHTIIMVGIAFGIQPKKQKIGDVLVSEQVSDYSLKRIGTDENDSPHILNRGDKIPASPRLLQRLRASSLRWDLSNVKFGLIVTGDDLVDNLNRRREILEYAPEAIGGEMEGAGLYSAAYRENVDWVIVKGICDWADGEKSRNKEVRQRKAARNSAQFVIETINSGSFLRADKAKSQNIEFRKEVDIAIRDIQNNLSDSSTISYVLTRCLDLCSDTGLMETYGLWIKKELEGYNDVKQFAGQFPNEDECYTWMKKWASYRRVRAYIKSQNIDEFTHEPYIQKLELQRVFIGDDIKSIAQRVTMMKRRGEIEYPVPYEALGNEYTEMRRAFQETLGKDLPRQTQVFINITEFEQILNKVRNLVREILSHVRTSSQS
jgi:nucleoside phosphorylase